MEQLEGPFIITKTLDEDDVWRERMHLVAPGTRIIFNWLPTFKGTVVFTERITGLELMLKADAVSAIGYGGGSVAQHRKE